MVGTATEPFRELLPCAREWGISSGHGFNGVHEVRRGLSEDQFQGMTEQSWKPS